MRTAGPAAVAVFIAGAAAGVVGLTPDGAVFPAPADTGVPGLEGAPAAGIAAGAPAGLTAAPGAPGAPAGRGGREILMVSFRRSAGGLGATAGAEEDGVVGAAGTAGAPGNLGV